jgi:hypothetical protein
MPAPPNETTLDRLLLKGAEWAADIKARDAARDAKGGYRPLGLDLPDATVWWKVPLEGQDKFHQAIPRVDGRAFTKSKSARRKKGNSLPIDCDAHMRFI